MTTQLIDSIKNINAQIAVLQKQKEQLISNHSTEILNAVLQMMDWRAENIVKYSVAYSSFEQRITIEVWIKNDPNARYVFSLFELHGKSQIILRFREELH